MSKPKEKELVRERKETWKDCTWDDTRKCEESPRPICTQTGNIDMKPKINSN
jgi:hypothetical protein